MCNLASTQPRFHGLCSNGICYDKALEAGFGSCFFYLLIMIFLSPWKKHYPFCNIWSDVDSRFQYSNKYSEKKRILPTDAGSCDYFSDKSQSMRTRLSWKLQKLQSHRESNLKPSNICFPFAYVEIGWSAVCTGNYIIFVGENWEDAGCLLRSLLKSARSAYQPEFFLLILVVVYQHCLEQELQIQLVVVLHISKRTGLRLLNNS